MCACGLYAGRVGGAFRLGPLLSALPLARVYVCYLGETSMSKDMKYDAWGR